MGAARTSPGQSLPPFCLCMFNKAPLCAELALRPAYPGIPKVFCWLMLLCFPLGMLSLALEKTTKEERETET